VEVCWHRTRQDTWPQRYMRAYRRRTERYRGSRVRFPWKR